MFDSDVNSVEHDNLRIDVWDFNPEENVSEKFKKFGDIKDSRGLRKFIKETLHASAGKTTYDLLGSVEIPLKVSTLQFPNLLNLETCQKRKININFSKSIYLFFSKWRNCSKSGNKLRFSNCLVF